MLEKMLKLCFSQERCSLLCHFHNVFHWLHITMNYNTAEDPLQKKQEPIEQMRRNVTAEGEGLSCLF